MASGVGGREGYSLIAENVDVEDPSRLTGTFNVHWAAGDSAPERWRQGPQEATIDEAIEWGRSMADVVTIQLDGGELLLSAGARQPSGDPLPEWPTDGLVVRPRPTGTPLDGSKQVRLWRITGRIGLSAADVVADAVKARVLRDPRVKQVEFNTAGSTGLQVRVLVEGRGARAALLAVNDLVTDAIEALVPYKPRTDLIPELGVDFDY